MLFSNHMHRAVRAVLLVTHCHIECLIGLVIVACNSLPSLVCLSLEVHIISLHFAGSMREWLNGNFRMECGKGVAESKWYKDGITLDGQSSRTVIVTNETRDPFGLYTCKADDVIGQWYLPMQASKGNVYTYKSYWGVGIEEQKQAGI